MARIRSIKPDIWTDENFVELSPLARLLFIGLWNFADDDGRMEYSPTRLKLQILPADSCDISALLGEIRGKQRVVVYEVDGKEYLQIVNFTKHQKVDKRTPSKYPEPTSKPAESPRIVQTEGKGMEGNGREGNGRDSTVANATVAKPPVSPCPHLEIIALYHQHLPMGTKVNVKLWNGPRAQRLKARWQDSMKFWNPEVQGVEWWKQFFEHCAESKFLTGRKPPRFPGDTEFQVTLDYVLQPRDFARVIEGFYNRERT